MSIKKAGIIEGDPLRGLCFRECIEVTKVFDGCLSRFVDIPYTARVEGEVFPLPYTYLDAHTDGESTIRNLKIVYLDDLQDINGRTESIQRIRRDRDRGGCRCDNPDRRPSRQERLPRPARVEFDTVIPIEIDYDDAAGIEHHAHSSVTLRRRVKLLLPPESLTPFTIKTSCVLESEIGAFTDGNQAVFRACIVQIVKVVETVDLLVPSYGYCEYPECEDNEACGEINNLPVFPPFV